MMLKMDMHFLLVWLVSIWFLDPTPVNLFSLQQSFVLMVEVLLDCKPHIKNGIIA